MSSFSYKSISPDQHHERYAPSTSTTDIKAPERNWYHLRRAFCGKENRKREWEGTREPMRNDGKNWAYSIFTLLMAWWLCDLSEKGWNLAYYGHHCIHSSCHYKKYSRHSVENWLTRWMNKPESDKEAATLLSLIWHKIAIHPVISDSLEVLLWIHISQ